MNNLIVDVDGNNWFVNVYNLDYFKKMYTEFLNETDFIEDDEKEKLSVELNSAEAIEDIVSVGEKVCDAMGCYDMGSFYQGPYIVNDDIAEYLQETIDEKGEGFCWTINAEDVEMIDAIDTLNEHLTKKLVITEE